MATIHNSAEVGEIAKTVLMPGDPMRAKYIAEQFFENPRLVNDVRCAYTYTGTFEGKEVTVMASGMGQGSMGIYSQELFNEYKVDKIIRVGSAGSINDRLSLGDIVIASVASTDSGFSASYNLGGIFAPPGDFKLIQRADSFCAAEGISRYVGSVFSGIKFHYPEGYFTQWANMGVLAVEMETYALYANAAAEGKGAVSLLTISDLLLTGEKMTSTERETQFGSMITCALSLVD